MKVEPLPRTRGIPTVRDVMQKSLITVPQDATLGELARLLTRHKITGVPVVDEEGDVVGVVSMTDLTAFAARVRRGGGAEPEPRYYRDLWLDDDLSEGFVEGMYDDDYASSTRVWEIMTKTVYMLNEGTPVCDLVKLMLDLRIHRVLVTDGKSVVGIVTTVDVMRLIPELLENCQGETIP